MHSAEKMRRAAQEPAAGRAAVKPKAREEGYAVAGCGKPKLNGIYWRMQGSEQAKGYSQPFKQETGNGTLEFFTTKGQWVLTKDFNSKRPYYSANIALGSKSEAPPLSGWQVVEGVAPEPTLMLTTRVPLNPAVDVSEAIGAEHARTLPKQDLSPTGISKRNVNGGFFATERLTEPIDPLGVTRVVPKVHHDQHPATFELPKPPHQSCGTQEKEPVTVSPPTVHHDPRLKGENAAKSRW